MPAVRKAVDERLYLSEASGGGMLRREIWVNAQGSAVRYNLAYINPLVFPGDNGCVLGYDSAHGTPHRHWRGKVTTVEPASFEEIEVRFQEEWTKLSKEVKRAKK
jgi:hypothetical protein